MALTLPDLPYDHAALEPTIDAQNTYPIWNATPLVALDVYEHAYFLDFQTDRAGYIDRFFDNLDWAVVNDWVSKYQIPLK